MVIDEDVRTTDVDEAERLIARVYRRGRVLETRDPFLFQQTVRGDERVRIAHYRIASPTVIAVEIDGMLGVGSRVAGSYRAASNGDEIDPAGAFLLRPGEAQSWSRGLELIVVNLDVSALAGAAGMPSTGSTNVRFDSLAPVSPALQQQWDAVRRFAVQTLEDPALLDQELVRRAVGDVLIANVLACFAVEFPAATEPHRDGQPATLRRALQFIDDNAARPIGVQEIAEAARLSPRGLQDLFRRSLGVTPIHHLRTVRLDAARADLLASGPEDTSVAEIANRWGFAHVARFAGWYREAYGENPSRTLRR